MKKSIKKTVLIVACAIAAGSAVFANPKQDKKIVEVKKETYLPVFGVTVTESKIKPAAPKTEVQVKVNNSVKPEVNKKHDEKLKKNLNKHEECRKHDCKKVHPDKIRHDKKHKHNNAKKSKIRHDDHPKKQDLKRPVSKKLRAENDR